MAVKKTSTVRAYSSLASLMCSMRFTGSLGGNAQGRDCAPGFAARSLEGSAAESDRAQEEEHAC